MKLSVSDVFLPRCFKVVEEDAEAMEKVTRPYDGSFKEC